KTVPVAESAERGFSERDSVFFVQVGHFPPFPPPSRGTALSSFSASWPARTLTSAGTSKRCPTVLSQSRTSRSGAHAEWSLPYGSVPVPDFCMSPIPTHPPDRRHVKVRRLAP